MVGLPARGKSFLSKKICRFLLWQGYNCKVFNIGNYRRELYKADCKADFFNKDNKEAV